jgi:hypothetical protein
MGGGGKGGPGSGVGEGYFYAVSFEMGLCEGPIAGIGMSWQSKKLYKTPHPKLTIFNGDYPQAPWTYMTTNHPTQAIGYPGLAKVAVNRISLGASNALPNWNFEVKGFNVQVGLTSTFSQVMPIPEKKPYTIIVANRTSFVSDVSVVFTATGTALTKVAAPPGDNQYSLGTGDNVGTYTFNKADKDLDVTITYTATNQDANPSDIVTGIVTNTKYGLGLPASLIEVTDWGNYCLAANILMSPEFTSQTTIAEAIGSILNHTCSDMRWHDGAVMEFIPYADTSVTGNGATWNPNVTAAYDLTDDDFMGDSKDDPIKITRTAPSDAFNTLQVEFLNRANEYNHQTYECIDQAAIDLYGRRPSGQKSLLMFKEVGIAQYVAQLLLQRQIYVRNIYKFTVGWKYCRLEPMDIVTLTDSKLGMSQTPVRIISLEENENGEWDIEAEDFPLGVGHAAIYGAGSSGGRHIDYNADPEDVNTPVIFSAPGILTDSGYEVWCALTGDTEVWGGADVWVSTDDVTYAWVGRVKAPARYGTLSADFLTGSDPDTVHTCAVDLTISAGELLSGTQDDADNHVTMCLVGGEIIAYKTATLTATNKYDLKDYIRRGLYNSGIATHNSGASFVRLDDAVFKYRFNPELVGKTLYLKFCSFNQYNGEAQDISLVTGYSYVLTAGNTPPSDVSFDDANCNFDGPYPVLAWTAIADPLFKIDGYELRYGASWVAGTKIDFVKKATSYKWTKYTTALGRGPVTVWIAAKDTYGNYSTTPDSVALTNTAPTMSGFSPTVTVDKKSKSATVDWSAWSGLTATDLDKFLIYASTEATCTIADANLKATVAGGQKQKTISGLSKGVTYDFRVVPWDTFGAGTASS